MGANDVPKQGPGSRPRGESRHRVARKATECSRHPKPLRLALVSGDETTQPAVRELLETGLEGWTLEMVEVPLRALAASPGSQPDVLLMEAGEPGGRSLHRLRKVRGLFPAAPIVVLTSRSDDASILDWLSAGAANCLVKPVGAGELALALKAAAEGRLAYGQDAQRALRGFLRYANQGGDSWGLTAMERQVLALVAQNKSEKDIVEVLGITRNTLHAHMDHLFKKLHVHKREDAAKKFFGRPTKT